MTIPLLSAGPLSKPARVLLVLAALLGSLGSGCRSRPGSDLEPGKPVVREIGGAEYHTYRLYLEPGSYLRLRIDQPGIDVEAKLISPRGRELGFFDEPKPLEEPDRLALLSKSGGRYRLAVRAKHPGTARGKYRLSLQELRSSNAQDPERLTAEAEYQKARRLLAVDVNTGPNQSLRWFQGALQRWQTVEDRTGQVDALNQIAQVQNGFSQSNPALSSAGKALQLAREENYPEGEARAFSSLGDAYSRLTKRDKALDCFTKSLSLWKKLGDVRWQGVTLYSMGQSLHKHPSEDFKALEEARVLLHMAGDLVSEANARTAEGYLEANRGEYGKALEQAEAALNLSKSAGDDSARSYVLSLLGAVHKSRGELEEALRNFQEALDLNISLHDSLAEAFTRQGLGSVYFNLGDPDRTLVEYDRALQISRAVRRTDLETRLLTNTGYVYQYAKHDPETALGYYRGALKLEQDPSGKALALNNSGAAYTTIGRAREGLPFLLDALKLREKINERNLQPNTLLEIGTAYMVLGDPRAEDNFHKALDLSRSLGNTGLQAESLYRWALLDHNRGKLKDALARIKDSLRIVESVRSQVITDKWRTSFFASKRSYYELLVNLLGQLEERNPGKYRNEALEGSERARSRGLLDLLAEGNVRAEVPPDLQQKDIELRSRLSWVQGQLGKGSSAYLQAQLDKVQDSMERLEVEIRKRDQHYAEIRYPSTLRADQIRALVDDQTVLLHYFVGDEASFLFVVTRKGLEIHRLPGALALAGQVSQFRSLIQARGPRNLPRFKETAGSLYSTLLGPATAALKGKSRLLIAPDGPLYRLPFEALLTESQGNSYGELPYLLRRYAVSYIPSASVLADLRKSRPIENPSKKFLAFADPDYRGVSTGGLRASSGTRSQAAVGLTQLPESGREVKAIAELFPAGDSVLYVGAEATKKNVEQNPLLQRTPLVHFALHGTVSETRPELSGLELSDGRLQVSEIFNLRLNAGLLTLSACDTALGREVRGEGMVGLTRAFLYAGARSVVVSLWPVADRSTADFMHDMYRNLPTGKAEALRRAKLSMISTREFAEPYYWAPFILSGDPR
ncbi:MAG TPA: CHAT domain-containing protein [Thermoanaerobaculia bacterium]|nr:CHAT domain-containing protein [Thermoanaerobaculia bacterium]